MEGSPPGGARAMGVFILKAPGRAIISVRKFLVARSCLRRSKSIQGTRCCLSKSWRNILLNSVWGIRRRETGNAGCLWVCVVKILVGYKHGRPLTVLPRNRSRLPQGLPLNGVPGGGVPSLQVEGCQASNTSKAHHLIQMHKTR